MEALHDVVKAGKARYIGASSMWAWQFSKLQYTARVHGWTRFVSMQNQYSLMQREDERRARHPADRRGGPAARGALHPPDANRLPVIPAGRGPGRQALSAIGIISRTSMELPG
jgi:hypothetical protein